MPISSRDAFEVQCTCGAVIEAIESGSRIDVREARQAVLDGNGGQGSGRGKRGG